MQYFIYEMYISINNKSLFWMLGDVYWECVFIIHHLWLNTPTAARVGAQYSAVVLEFLRSMLCERQDYLNHNKKWNLFVVLSLNWRLNQVDQVLISAESSSSIYVQCYLHGSICEQFFVGHAWLFFDKDRSVEWWKIIAVTLLTVNLMRSYSIWEVSSALMISQALVWGRLRSLGF